jgi:glycerol-3-phosphate O-acyltransferase/dihydroxyacetone phosphate acyltransferase
MALGAMALHNIEVDIVCCGLNYYACDKFRSKVIIEFGKAYTPPKELVERYKISRKDAIGSML